MIEQSELVHWSVLNTASVQVLSLLNLLQFFSIAQWCVFSLLPLSAHATDYPEHQKNKTIFFPFRNFLSTALIDLKGFSVMKAQC